MAPAPTTAPHVAALLVAPPVPRAPAATPVVTAAPTTDPLTIALAKTSVAAALPNTPTSVLAPYPPLVTPSATTLPVLAVLVTAATAPGAKSGQKQVLLATEYDKQSVSSVRLYINTYPTKRSPEFARAISPLAQLTYSE